MQKLIAIANTRSYGCREHRYPQPDHRTFGLKGEFMVRERSFCIDCSQLIQKEPIGTCKKYRWQISMALARSDKVCSYESFKDKWLNDK
jgi:hypothetical protein